MVLWVVVAVVVVVGIVFAVCGWDRYRGNRAAVADGSLQPTSEVFIDPESGRRMRVWHDPNTGLREYRPEQSSDSAPSS